MKNEMLVLGLGQAGGNMVEELYNRGFNVIAINTAIDDLDSLDIEKEFKFHIKNATGTAKNRVLSKQLAKSVANQIVEIINEKYTSMKYIHIISSLAGGTGGGSIAAVSSMLQSVFTDKYIFAVTVIYTLLVIGLYILIGKISTIRKRRVIKKQNAKELAKLPIGFYLCIADILVLIYSIII